MASPWDRVEEAEEEVEEPWTERLIQESGLCRLGLTGGGGATTDDCLRTDVSSSEPDEESEQERERYEFRTKTVSKTVMTGHADLSFPSYLVVCGFRWETARKWSAFW